MRPRLCLFWGLILILGSPAAPARAETAAPTVLETAKPTVHRPPAGRKWRVIYVEGGNFKEYCLTLAGLAHGLEQLGLIAHGRVPVAEDSEDARPLWEWLAANAGGDRLEFLADGYYSAGWDEAERARIKSAVLERIRGRGDVDLILTAGTSAGQDLATAEHRIPVMANSVTSPVASGISRTNQDSGLDHVHVQVDADRLERQVRIFYDLFKFQRLGVPLDSSPQGRAALGQSLLEGMARELNFTLVPCMRDLEISDAELSVRNLRECLEILVRDSDAVFLTFNNGMRPEHMAELLAPLIKYKRPSFSQSGPDETALGVLVSLGQDNYEAAGLFEARALQEIVDGRKPREVNQIFDSPLTLAVNLAMARAIGWNPPFEVLVTADELYQTLAREADPRSGR